MNREDLRQLSRIRIKESAILLKANRYAGAYYLAGYSVECGIKACIARQTRRWEFPDKDTVNKSWTHDLEQLIGVAGLRPALQSEMQANPAFAVNWTLVKDWNESFRYDPNVSVQQAKDLYSACTNRKDGILSWVRKQW